MYTKVSRDDKGPSDLMKFIGHNAVNSSLVCIQEGAKTPLFCIHPVGGTVFCYAEIARHLGSKQPVYGFQSRGLGGAQEPLTSISEMASAYLELMRTIQPHEPYYLGGWSLGGIIAFEMAQQLHSLGMRTALLALIDSYLPRAGFLPGKNLPGRTNESQLLIAFALELGVLPARLREAGKSLGDWGKKKFADIVSIARQEGLLPEDLDYEMTQRLFKVFKANHRAIWIYVPRSYPGKITYFSAQTQGSGYPAMASIWNSLAREGMEHHVLPGNHYTIFNQTNSKLLAKQLRHCMANAEAGTATNNW